jgi:predicted permease
VEGYQPAEGEQMQSTINLIGPRYAETMGMPLRAGRDVGERDGSGAPLVAVVNEAFAQAYFKSGNAVGQRIGMGDDPDERGRYEIIGVVGDARFEGPDQAPGKMLFLPILQAGDQSAYTSELALRVSGDAASLGPAVRAAVAAVDPRLPISEITTMDTQFAQALFQPRLFARLVTIFGAVAVLLACVGLYGVVAQSVARRTSELGIRMALGADRGSILRMVLSETLRLIGLGLLIGIPSAIAAAQLLRGQLYGVGPAEPLTIALTSLLLVAVATVAGYLPARRAASVPPMAALRGE